MIAYIPIPNNSTPNKDVIDSLLKQVDKVVTVPCGELRERKDRNRYIDIGKGRIECMKLAVESGEEFFVTNNSGALHKDEYGIVRCIHFLKANPEWAGVSLPRYKIASLESGHIEQECVVYRTEAVKDIEKYIHWDTKTCECAKIRNALTKYKGKRFGYLEKEPKHIKDTGEGFTINQPTTGEENAQD